MSTLSLRKQARTGDERQLFRPDQLEPGMSIAMVNIFEGTRRRERLLKAAFAFTGLIGHHENQSRFRAALEGWRHNDLQGLLPRWRGIVEWCNDDGAMIELTGEPETPLRYSELMGTDPADLPDIEEPARQYSTFSDMGLAPITPPSIHLSDGIYTAEAGRWQRSATLHLQ